MLFIIVTLLPLIVGADNIVWGTLIALLAALFGG